MMLCIVYRLRNTPIGETEILSTVYSVIESIKHHVLNRCSYDLVQFMQLVVVKLTYRFI